MKPFNLERALAGAPVVTRKGAPVIEIHHFAKVENGDLSVYAIVDGYVRIFTKRGAYCLGVEHAFDLFMAPVKRVGWVNIYLDGHADGWSHCGQVVYTSEEEAKDNADRTSCPSGVVTVKVEWEE